MAFENWKKNADGKISVHPLMNFEIAGGADALLIVRLELMNPGDMPGKPTGSAQIVLAPSQAIELSAALSKNAEQLMRQSPGGL